MKWTVFWWTYPRDCVSNGTQHNVQLMACIVQFVLTFFYYFAFATADSDCKSGLAFVPHLPSPPYPATSIPKHCAQLHSEKFVSKMGDTIQVSVQIPVDDDGMIGRECFKCKKYFKLKPGTGLPTNYCHCPYCDYEGKSDTFFTQAQLEYAKSVGLNQVFHSHIKPSLDRLTNSFKELEKSSRNSLVKITVKSSGHHHFFPIKYYREAELETKLECDNCGLSILNIWCVRKVPRLQ